MCDWDLLDVCASGNADERIGLQKKQLDQKTNSPGKDKEQIERRKQEESSIQEQDHSFDMERNSEFQQVLQSRIIDGYRSNLKQMNEQKSVYNIEFLSDLKRKRDVQMDELKKAYKLISIAPLIPLGKIGREEYQIVFQSQNAVPLHIRLQIDEEFPRRRPKFYLEYELQQEFIKQDTLEIDYLKFYEWKSDSSTLIGITRIIEMKLKDNKLILDDVVFDFETQLKNELSSLNLNTIRALPLSKIFKTVSVENKQSEYDRLERAPELVNQQIQCTPEYAKLMQSCLSLSQDIQELAKNVKEKYSHIDGMNARIVEKHTQLESLKDSYILTSSLLNQIEDRFESQAAMAIINCEIHCLDEKVSEFYAASKELDQQKSLRERAKEFLNAKKECRHLQILKENMEKSL